MGHSALEVADIVRGHQREFIEAREGRLSTMERKVLRAIVSCRTAALGGHVDECDHCGNIAISYNSCRNRHCPKCQASAGRAWIEEREADLLPVEYFHIVFTMPQELATIALRNKEVLYSILFQATTETLQQVALTHLGVEIGVLAVLHTWGQRLEHHPHLHCIVPGGGLSQETGSWVGCRAGFFVPVRVMSHLFRGKFLYLLKKAHAAGKLELTGTLSELETEDQFLRYLRPLYEKEWFVYSKPPFGGPHRVLKYLARYTHRVAIANSRLVSLVDGQVSFRWKDYANDCRVGLTTLDATEFIRRFLLHVLPKGFTRIRHYGLFANCHRGEKLNRCRETLGNVEAKVESVDCSGDEPGREIGAASPRPCPDCKVGHMITIETFDAGKTPLLRQHDHPPDDHP